MRGAAADKFNAILGQIMIGLDHLQYPHLLNRPIVREAYIVNCFQLKRNTGGS